MPPFCAACYLATTEPRWLAEFVCKFFKDTPCEKHRDRKESGA